MHTILMKNSIHSVSIISQIHLLKNFFFKQTHIDAYLSICNSDNQMMNWYLTPKTF